MVQKLRIVGVNLLSSLVIYSLVMLFVFYFFHYGVNVFVGLLIGYFLGSISLGIMSWRIFKQIKDSSGGKFTYAFLSFVLGIPAYVYTLFWLALIF